MPEITTLPSEATVDVDNDYTLLVDVSETPDALNKVTPAALLGTNLKQIRELADPGADRLLFWDDSANAFTHLTPGTNLSITGTTINASGGGGGAIPETEIASETNWNDLITLATANPSNTYYGVITSGFSISTADTIPANMYYRAVNGQMITDGGGGTIDHDGIGLLEPKSRVPIFSGFAAGDITWTGTLYPVRITETLWDSATLDLRVKAATAAMVGRKVQIIAHEGVFASQVTLNTRHNLHLTAGNYTSSVSSAVTSILVMNNSTSLTGDGPQTTFLQEAPGNIQIMRASSVAAGPFNGYNEDLYISDICFQGHADGLVDSSKAAVMIGNTKRFQVTRCHFRDVNGFCVYVGAFGTAGNDAEDGLVSFCIANKSKTQAFGILNGRNVTFDNIICTELQPMKTWVTDAVTNSTDTVTSVTGFSPSCVEGVKLTSPTGTTFTASVVSGAGTNTLVLSGAVPFTATGVSLEKPPPLQVVVDHEPNSTGGIFENVRTTNFTIDGRMAQENWSGIIFQATDAIACKNPMVSGNTIIGKDLPTLVFYDTDVNTGADTVTLTEHGLETGQIVASTIVGSLPGGLTANTYYNVIKVDNDTIKFAYSYAYAQAGTAINITSTGTGKNILEPVSRLVSGIIMDGAMGGRVENNFVSGGSQSGFNLNLCAEVTVEGNDVVDCGGGGTPGAALLGSVNCRVRDNHIRKSAYTVSGSLASTEMKETEFTGYTVNTNGTAIESIANRMRRWFAGRTVTINSVDYTMDYVRDVTHAVLTATAGVQGPVAMSTKFGASTGNTFENNECVLETLPGSDILSTYTDRKITTVSDAAHTATTASGVIVYTALSAARAVTLPDATKCKGKEITVKDSSGAAATYDITLTPVSSQTIDGANSYAINANYGSLTVKSNGANWITLNVIGAQAAAFDIASLSGLSMWLKADAITGLVDNDPVTTWEDAHTSNKDATQATGGAKPLYKTNVVNSLPAVRFDATDDGMTTALALTAPYSIFAVYAWKGSSNATRRVIQDATGNIVFGPYQGKHDYYDGSFRTGAPAAVQNDFVYVSLIVGATNTSFYVDGTLIETKANGTNTFNALALGSHVNHAEPADSDVAEIIVTNVDSSSVRANVEGYLADKYAL